MSNTYCFFVGNTGIYSIGVIIKGLCSLILTKSQFRLPPKKRAQVVASRMAPTLICQLSRGFRVWGLGFGVQAKCQLSRERVLGFKV